MKAPKIIKAMEYIDDELIADASAYSPQRIKLVWLKWGAVAACLCFILVGSVTLFRRQRTNTPVYGVLAEVTQILGDNEFEAVITGADKNFSENDIITVIYKSGDDAAIAVSDTVAITYSKFEKGENDYKISAGFVEIVFGSAKQTGDNEIIEFHGEEFNKADLSDETLEWLERYYSLSPGEQLSLSYVPSELYTYDVDGDTDEIAGE